MEFWFIFLSLFICFVLKLLLNLILDKKYNKREHKLPLPLPLPPGPFTFPIIGKFFWQRKSFSDLEPILRELHTKYGPIVSLPIGSQRAIFIRTHDLAHEALVKKGTIFTSRPPVMGAGRLENRFNISSSGYGPVWRLLRRNLTSEMLHPSRLKSYSRARKWVLQVLTTKLKAESQSGKAIPMMDHIQYAMFSLLVFMCFGKKLEEKEVREIKTVQSTFFQNSSRFDTLDFLPWLARILFRKLWNELLEILHKQENLFIPLIRAREERRKNANSKLEEDFVNSYVDTLLDLNLPEDGRKLNEAEMVSLCSEFLTGGTDTTSTALQWILANLVKHQHIQSKLVAEIEGVVGSGEKINEEDLQKMPYLKAVVLEGLRRHPPAHFLLPHAVTEDTTLNGYLIPKNATTVNVTLAEISRDPDAWEDPMEFRPERFLSRIVQGEEVIDIIGKKEIKMMPFGAGRRICPALGLALLHLGYFVANLVRDFEWKPRDGDDIDLSEEQKFTFVMKNPLHALIYSRIR
ncbi:cytochrome P450 89A2-like [Macadamia integrifolia]|uniref:cytochrome P450 89A2-like n=1 Tax=Macadamia integrifolia TaxID=60698 RepID=UPI001C52D15F|nr:cytochrome P450 89A2-like [Macadamia integrifolia]